jgi:uncharacterized damage-inducible protein DinB
MNMTEASQLAAKLKSEGEKFADFFANLADQEWNTTVYAEGTTWTVRSILAHLMTAERAFVKLFEQIRRGGPGVSEDFVIDRYNASQQEKTRELNPEELLRRYRDVRGEMVAWVSTLSDTDLELRGRHPFLGVTSLREMIKLIYIHNQTHYRDLRRALNIQG